MLPLFRDLDSDFLSVKSATIEGEEFECIPITFNINESPSLCPSAALRVGESGSEVTYPGPIAEELNHFSGRRLRGEPNE
jgi:hypothetical protein